MVHLGTVIVPVDVSFSLLCVESEVAQSCLTLRDLMDCSTPGLPCPASPPAACSNSLSIESVMSSSHLILCHPLLLLPSIFPSTRVFSNELVLHIRCPKFWSFSFSISPSNEYSGLISFRIDWFDLLQSKGLSRVFSNTTVQSTNSSALSFLYSPILTSIHDYWKNHSFD